MPLRHHKLPRLLQLPILLTIVLGLSLAQASNAAIPAAADSTAHIQPQLSALAAQEPDRIVSVIVQKLISDASVETVARQLGATVVRDLGIINAVEVELPAASVVKLARHAGVRWISLNGAVVGQQALDVSTTWATELGTYDLQLNTKVGDFNATPIRAGSTIWFSSVAKVSGLSAAPASFIYSDAMIEFSANGVDYRLPVPDGRISVTPGLTQAATTYDQVAGRWDTTVPAQYDNDIFLSGLGFTAPVDLPGGLKNVRWSGRLTTDTPTITVDWRWAAAIYSRFSSDNNALLVKPIKDDRYNPYPNADRAGAPQAFRADVIKGARGNGGNDFTGGYTTWAALVYAFNEGTNVVDAVVGPADTFAVGRRAVGAFTGFAAELSPGNTITRVELLLNAYVDRSIDKDPKLIVTVAGASKSMPLSRNLLNAQVGMASRTTLAYDITALRPWTWADFDANLELTIDQTELGNDRYVYYDAVGLRISSMPGGSTNATSPIPRKVAPAQPLNLDQLSNAYNYAVRVPEVWNEGPKYLQGQGVTVAVVDSGVFKTSDLKDSIVRSINFSRGFRTSNDQYGHGTFVAGLIAGDGSNSKGMRIGIAPESSLLNVRISNDEGMATEADVVASLQWIYQNRSIYGIRVVNLSLNAAIPQSYHTSPLAAACEVLWFNGIVVVVSAGNNGVHSPSVLLPPANDPFVITVGATDDQGTPSIADDQMAPFSAFGVTPEGPAKPDLVAPGVKIVGQLPNNDQLNMSRNHGTNRIDKNYFRMSGTSMAAPMVSGAAALLLQDEPQLTPDQVKYRLMMTANRSWPGYDPSLAGAGYLDIYAAVHSTTMESANTGIPASQLLWTGTNSAAWGSVNWGSVNWGSVNWGSVNWGSVNWGSDYWDE